MLVSGPSSTHSPPDVAGRSVLGTVERVRRTLAEPRWVRGIASATVVVLAAALSALPRLVELDRVDLRLDEAFTRWVAGLPVPTIPGFLAEYDTHPPLHYLVMSLLGDDPSDAAMRRPSVLFGVLTVAMAIVGVRALTVVARSRIGDGPRWVGAIVAGTLTAASPVLIHASRDARMYGLAALLVVVTVVVAGWAVERDTVGPRAVAGAFAACAALTNLTALPPVAVAVGVLLLVDLRRRRWAAAAVAPVVALVVYAPWLPTVVAQLAAAEGNPNLAWLGDPGFELPLRGTSALFHPTLVPGATITVLVVAVLAAAICAMTDRSSQVALLTAATVAAVVVPIVAAGTRQALPFPRSLTVAVALVGILIGVAYARAAPFGRTLAAGTIVTALVVTIAGGARIVPPDPGTDFRVTAQLLAQRIEPGDLIVYVGSYAQIPIERYAPQLQAHRAIGLPTTFVDEPRWEAPVTFLDERRLRARVREQERVFLVQVRTGALDEDRRTVRALRAEHERTIGFRFRGIVLSEYRLPVEEP